MTRTTVLVPAWGRLDATRRALASLRAAGAPRILVVDDEGKGGGAELAAAFPEIEVLETSTPVYWTGAIALAMRHAFARGDDGVLFFNQDVTLEPGYFEALETTAARFPDDILGSVVVYAHDPRVVWSAGGAVEWFGRGVRMLGLGEPVSGLPREPWRVDWLPGMGTWVPRAAYQALGLPDGDAFPMAWGDLDYALRARDAGIALRVDPRLVLRHEVGPYDPRVAGSPSLRLYVSWLRNPMHNVSLASHAEIWRRHGPRFLWPLSLGIRVAVLAANWVRMRLSFPVSTDGA